MTHTQQQLESAQAEVAGMRARQEALWQKWEKALPGMIVMAERIVAGHPAPDSLMRETYPDMLQLVASELVCRGAEQTLKLAEAEAALMAEQRKQAESN